MVQYKCCESSQCSFSFQVDTKALVADLSTFAPVAQLDRALACGAKGRRFESCRVYQNLG